MILVTSFSFLWGVLVFFCGLGAYGCYKSPSVRSGLGYLPCFRKSEGDEDEHASDVGDADSTAAVGFKDLPADTTCELNESQNESQNYLCCCIRRKIEEPKEKKDDEQEHGENQSQQSQSEHEQSGSQTSTKPQRRSQRPVTQQVRRQGAPLTVTDFLNEKEKSEKSASA